MLPFLKPHRYYLTLSLVLLALLLPFSAMSESDGSQRIRLQGDVLASAPKRVTVNDIESIGLVDLHAFNPYEKRADDYSGVWLKDIVTHFAPANTAQVTTSAIDGYAIDFKAEEWQHLRILVATRVNGKHIGYEQKGPMRIVFPDYDASLPVYQANMSKWMWMINTLTFSQAQ